MAVFTSFRRRSVQFGSFLYYVRLGWSGGWFLAMSSSIDNILLRLASGGKGGEGSEINLLYLSIFGISNRIYVRNALGLGFSD